MKEGGGGTSGLNLGGSGRAGLDLMGVVRSEVLLLATMLCSFFPAALGEGEE